MSFEQRLQDSGKDQDGRTALQDAVHNVHTREDAEIYMETMLAHALDFRDSREDSRYADIIGRAKELVAANYNKKLSLDEVADQVGMSPSYFSFIFSKETGQTFVAYLTEVRVQKAKEMLENSAMKTSEIGFEVGYKEPHYFCTVFKRSEGCSPKEYRFRSGETALMKFCDIDSQEQAAALTGCEVHFPTALAAPGEDGMPLAAVAGFALVSAADGTVVGRIARIDDATANLLFELEDGRLVPAAEELVENVDMERREVRVSLPEGLFDL